MHGGVGNDCGVEIVRVDARRLKRKGRTRRCKAWAASWCRRLRRTGHRGKNCRRAIRPRNKIPYLGLCLGMQIATIEFARNVLKLAKAHSTEFDVSTPHPVIAMLDEQRRVTKKGGRCGWGRSPASWRWGPKRRNSTARS